MCLAVYANGVGEGAGTHVSIAILLLEMLTGVDAYQLQKTGCVSTPTSSYSVRQLSNSNGIQSINVCFSQPTGILAQMLQLRNKRDQFCSLESPHLYLHG